MKTRTTISTIIASTLLATAALPGIAHGSVETAYVTGSVIYPDGECTDTTDAMVCSGAGFEADDPRLDVSGSLAMRMNDTIDAGGLEFAMAVAFTRDLSNDEGSWSGSSTSFVVFGEEGKIGDSETIVLEGAGGYEGLSAIVEVDGASETFEALIFEGQVPAAPASVVD